MTWVRHSDKAHRAEALTLAGRDGKLLWYDALGECAAYDDGAGRDGVLTPVMIRAAAVLSDPVLPYKRLTPKLVELGLWHDTTTVTSCSDCLARGGASLAGDELLIHEWWTRLLTAAGKHDGVVRDHERRGKRLDRHPELTAMIRKRDRDLCRYCGVLTRWDADRKSKVAGTYDHVDPFGSNSFANVVVACRRCNGVKKDRTPEQAGMELLPEPDRYQPTDQATGPDPINPKSSHILETGRDGSGTDSGSAPGRIGAGSVAGPDPGTGLGLAVAAAVNGNGHRNGHAPHDDRPVS